MRHDVSVMCTCMFVERIAALIVYSHFVNVHTSYNFHTSLILCSRSVGRIPRSQTRNILYIQSQHYHHATYYI